MGEGVRGVEVDGLLVFGDGLVQLVVILQCEAEVDVGGAGRRT